MRTRTMSASGSAAGRNTPRQPGSGTATLDSLLQHRHMKTAADFHPLPPIERDCRVIIGKYVQERNLASRQDLAGHRGQQHLRGAAAPTGRMHAARRYLGIIGGLHALSRHGDELPIYSNAEKRPQFVRSQREWAG